MGFGTVVYFLNLDKQPEDEIMTSRFGLAFLDIFQNQYEQTLGEFNLDYEQTIEKEIMTLIFTAATFYVIIVLLNMLIAIMGDIFERAVDERVQNRQREMFNIMSEYMEVVDDDVKK